MGDNFSDIHNSNINNRITNNYYGNHSPNNTDADTDILEKAKKAIQQGALSLAIEHLHTYLDSTQQQHHEDTLLLIEGRLSRLTTQQARGIVTHEQATLQENQLSSSIQSLIQQLR